MKKILGVLCTSSKIIYGFNKRSMPLKKFISFDNPQENIIVATKYPLLAYDIYASVLPNNNFMGNNMIATIDQYFGKIGDFNVEEQFLIHSRQVNYKKYDKFFHQSYLHDNYQNVRTIIDENIISIDPDSILDIDDAIHVKTNNDTYEIGIHIADVSAFIKEGSALDIIIKQKASSVYLPNNTIHMLPSDLVSHISLVEKIPKAAFSLIINMDKDNNIINYKFIRTTIIVNNNYSYDQAQNLLDHNDQTLSLMSKISNSTDTHKIVEYFMILANQITAKHLIKNNYPCILRVHNEIANYQYYDTNIFDQKHNALNIEYYSHFTSPLRRYIDIMIHRYLCNDEEYDEIDLQLINNKLIQIKKVQNESNKLEIIKKICINHDSVLITDAKIISFDNNSICVHIIELNLRVYFKLIPNKLIKTVNYISSKTKFTINNITLLENDIIKIKVIACNLTPFISKKLRFQIINPLFIY